MGLQQFREYVQRGGDVTVPVVPAGASLADLFNNLLYDSNQLAIPTDNVDPEQLARPSRWGVGFIERFILFFGRSARYPTSSPSASCCGSSTPTHPSSVPAGSLNHSPPRHW